MKRVFFVIAAAAALTVAGQAQSLRQRMEAATMPLTPAPVYNPYAYTVPVTPVAPLPSYPLTGSSVSGYSNQIGNTNWYNFSNGLSGYSNQIGNTTWYNFNNGVSGYSNPIGSTTWYNFWK